MPMYQTKTIAGILEPVAQQVSKLIILHEEGEDGNPMPDLQRPVQAVSKAVDNLTRVGKDTVSSSQDSKLKSDMPRALTAIERSSRMLEEACNEMKRDPYSQQGRDKLISGSRGILQGTTSMLVSFDESQVRKVVRDCKKVLDYLAISEVIETMEDLVQFVKDVSPCLSKVCQDVETRRKDLLNPYQKETLAQHLEQVKTLAPILICSMKIYIQILGQEGKGTEEAVENRNYLAQRMTEEVGDIIKILEDTSTTDDAAFKMTSSVNNWSSSSRSDLTFHEMVKQTTNVMSTKSSSSNSQVNQQMIRQIVQMATKIADGFEGHTKSELLQICNDLERTNQGNLSDSATAQKVAGLIKRLEGLVNESVIDKIIQDMADISTPLKQFTEAVLSNKPMAEKRFEVERTGQALKVFSNRLSKTANLVAFANARNKRRSEALLGLSSSIQTLTPQLINAGTICMNYPENRAAEENFENLRRQFADGIQNIRDICDESIDVKIFLQQTEEHIHRAVRQCEEAIRARNTPNIIENSAMAARLSNRLLMALNRESDNSDDPSLRRQVNETSEKLKSVIAPFVEKSKSVSQNPADPGLSHGWKSSSADLLNVVSQVTKLFDDLNMYGMDAPRMNNINNIPVKVIPSPPRPPLPQQQQQSPRQPNFVRPQPPQTSNHPDTDDEEGLFTGMPRTNRPIHAAAHGLYQEVKQWDHSDNEIIAAAKKIAYLMAHLSELVRPGRGTKRELLACARGLAEVSERITELCKELARHCTDKKIRTNLLQVCEKIPTLGTQLRVLSTVKATMMCNNMDTEEDQDAMDMLVFNAQKLNEAVKETVRAAESASIRVRSDAGFKLKWVRKPPLW